MHKLLLFLFLIITQFIHASELKYSRARIWFDGKPAYILAATGIDLSEGEYQKGKWFSSDFSEREILEIRKTGFRVEILIDDVKSFYRNRNNNTLKTSSVGTPCGIPAPEYPVPSHFHLGSMGGFYTYNEMLDIVDSMALLYPNLISAKQSIDATNTIENRPIYYLKISDNPNTDETEPEVLYDAVHHAREPESMTSLIYYMWYLLENYASDTAIKALVDNTEMYFIPCVNPDGYIYNEQTDPNGGGQWRKNRRDNLDGEFGVDLNRNYGYEWGYDTIGSSLNTFSNTYRGTSAFSEPETQAMRNFMNTRHFSLALNYHTFGSHHIIPWGYIPNLLTPDSLELQTFGEAVTRFNNYHVGTTNQTLNYLVNGVADDWMYGEQVSKAKIYSMTPEIGTNFDGFWPASNRIIPLSQENVYANLTLAKLAGRYGIVNHNEPRYVSQISNQFVFNFQQLGLDTSGTCTISIVPLTSNFASVGSPVTISNLSVLQSVADSISFNLVSSISQAEEIRYAVVANNGLYNFTDTISQLYGTNTTVFYDSANTFLSWSAFPSSFWGTTDEDYVSAPYSITDSPYNIYQPNANDPLTINNPINLTGSMDARLTFWAKWNFEAGVDYAQVLASSDMGINWTPLCGKYTVPGTSLQAQGEPLYNASRFDWVKEEMDLSDYLGQSILIRFLLISDVGQELDGFYFDDLSVETIPINTGLASISDSKIKLSQAYPNPAEESTVINFSNVPEGSVFFVYNTLAQKVFQLTIKQSSGKINLLIENFSNGLYNYCIRTSDGKQSSSHKFLVTKN